MRYGPQIFKQLARIKKPFSGARVAAPADALPHHVRTVAEHAFKNEANLWHMLVLGKRAVTPDLYRQSAENLRSLSVRKTRKLSE